MAEPGDPPPSDDHAQDDLIGFTSEASLAAVSRARETAPPTKPDPLPFPEEPEQASLFDPPADRLAAIRTRHTPDPAAPPNPIGVFGRAAALKASRSETLEGAMGLFAVYALILFAVPTFGAAAAVALAAVFVRQRPDQALARSHFDYQKRTLWIAAVVGVIGVLLIVVNLGVFVLFFLALWLLLRGAWGLMLLARAEAITRPRQWLIAAR